MRPHGTTTGIILTIAAAVAVSAAFAAARAETLFHQAGADLVGELSHYTTRSPDSLAGLARRFDLGYVELRAANPGVDPWLPGAGTRLTLPTAHILPDTPRRGIVVNLPEQRLYFFATRAVLTVPVGIGRKGRETPLGATAVVAKRPNPAWTPPQSIRLEKPWLPAVVAPGPNNPLGRFALDLAWPGYVIHGTNRPLGIGRRVSHGCIRLYPEDIAELYARTAVGTPVTVVDQPIKLGRRDGALYLEAHPAQAELDRLEQTGSLGPPTASAGAWIQARIRNRAADLAPRLDWPLIARVLDERRGIPVRITRP